MSPDRYGDVVIQGHWPGGTIEVIEAPPRALISGELLDELAICDSPYVTLDGNVLTIRAANRTLVYRIVGRHPDWLNHPDVYVIEWPD